MLIAVVISIMTIHCSYNKHTRLISYSRNGPGDEYAWIEQGSVPVVCEPFSVMNAVTTVVIVHAIKAKSKLKQVRQPSCPDSDRSSVGGGR